MRIQNMTDDFRILDDVKFSPWEVINLPTPSQQFLFQLTQQIQYFQILNTVSAAQFVDSALAGIPQLQYNGGGTEAATDGPTVAIEIITADQSVLDAFATMAAHINMLRTAMTVLDERQLLILGYLQDKDANISNLFASGAEEPPRENNDPSGF